MALVQYLTAVSANMGGFALGTVIGFSSPVAPLLLEGSGHNLLISESQLSWFSAIVSLGALIGSFIGGFSMNLIGRRGTMLMLVLPYTVGWGLIAGAVNFPMLLLGRIITGVSMGMCSVVIPTYNGEYPSPSRRGQLGSFFQLMIAIGILFSYTLGAIFHSFRYIAMVDGIIPLIFSGSMFFCKESPYFLMAKNRDEEAMAVLQHFRGKDVIIKEEFNEMKRTTAEKNKRKATIMDFKPPHVLKPLLISICLMLFQQLSGVNAVLFNMHSIFITSGITISENLASFIVGIMMVVTCLVGTQLIDRLGRKILLTVSALFMTLSLLALGVFFDQKEKAANGEDAQESTDSMTWLPLTSLIVFKVTYLLGYGPIPWVMMGELFSADVREMTATIATVVNWTTAFLVTLSFQSVRNLIDDRGMYWMFAFFCMVNTIFSLTIVPETKCKTLGEISAMFGGPGALTEKCAVQPEIIVEKKENRENYTEIKFDETRY